MAFSGITLGSPNTIVVGQGAQNKSFPMGTQLQPRAGALGDTIVQDLHGNYYETSYRGNLQTAYSVPSTLTSANATATGFILYNPLASGVNLAINKIALRVSVTSASMTGIDLAYNIQTTTPTGLTAATQVNAFLSGSAALAKAYTAATLASAPIPFVSLLHNTAAIATTGSDQELIDLQGSVIVPPGYAISLSALGAASAASAVSATFFWEEVPV